MISGRMVWLILVFWCLTPFSKIFTFVISTGIIF
jgi:hypothetical protein